MNSKIKMRTYNKGWLDIWFLFMIHKSSREEPLMLDESGCCLSNDSTVAQFWHLSPYESLDELLIIELSEAFLELGH